MARDAVVAVRGLAAEPGVVDGRGTQGCDERGWLEARARRDEREVGPAAQLDVFSHEPRAPVRPGVVARRVRVGHFLGEFEAGLGRLSQDVSGAAPRESVQALQARLAAHVKERRLAATLGGLLLRSAFPAIID